MFFFHDRLNLEFISNHFQIKVKVETLADNNWITTVTRLRNRTGGGVCLVNPDL